MATKTKKTTTKKKSKKKAKPTTKLPQPSADVLPRGRIRLDDGSIRLKTGTHTIEKEAEFDIAGVKMTLSGKVMVASKDVDWLSIGKCGKCSKARKEAVSVRQYEDGHVALTYRCASTEKQCDLGGMLYVQVHSPGRFSVQS